MWRRCAATLPVTRHPRRNCLPDGYSRTQTALAFARLGLVVPEIGRDDIREVIVQSYRLIYRLLPDEVEILTVHHGASPLTDFEPPDEA